MITVLHKGCSPIGNKMLHIHVFVEIGNEDYNYGCGCLVNTDKIANKSIQESQLFEKIFGKFAQCFSNVVVESDDLYDNCSIEDVHKKRNLNNIDILYDEDININYNQKEYKCNILLYIK